MLYFPCRGTKGEFNLMPPECSINEQFKWIAGFMVLACCDTIFLLHKHGIDKCETRLQFSDFQFTCTVSFVSRCIHGPCGQSFQSYLKSMFPTSGQSLATKLCTISSGLREVLTFSGNTFMQNVPRCSDLCFLHSKSCLM